MPPDDYQAGSRAILSGVDTKVSAGLNQGELKCHPKDRRKEGLSIAEESFEVCRRGYPRVEAVMCAEFATAHGHAGTPGTKAKLAKAPGCADCLDVARELGFANIAIGGVALGSLYLPGWVLPVSVIGAIFYGLVGMNHVTHGNRNALQTVAMTSDFFAATVLLVFCVATTSRWLVPM